MLVLVRNKSMAEAEGDLLEPHLMAQSDKDEKFALQT